MKTSHASLFICCVVVLSGIVIALPHTCIPGCCNGDLKDSSGIRIGTFSDWKAYADGTTNGRWSAETPYGAIVSDDATGIYVYDIDAGTATGDYTGTAYLPSHPEFGTSAYTMRLDLILPGGDYCYGTYDIDYDNSQ